MGAGGIDTPLIKGSRGDRTQITTFSITPKLIHLFYSMPQKILEKGMREKKGKKREKGLQGPPSTAHHPKTVVVEGDAAVVIDAVSGTAARGIVAPRTAPQWRIIIIPIFCPSTAIRRRNMIIIVPSIGAPFPDIAVHIVQPKGVSYLKIAHWGCFTSISSCGFIGISFSSSIVS
ncbi:hypothetical protein MTo_03844 [Microcystis aeruginosa NIES-1211]|nr:hypothetical protein MTo_03844 [Microcystis aeruginosa NIES-1211]